MPNINDSLINFFSKYGSHFKKGSSLLVACSGGPDSVALVRSLKSLGKILPWRFQIAHINHKLRGRESDQDAHFVEHLAKEVNWPFHLVRRPISRRSGNLEEKARVARYDALWKTALHWKCSCL